MKREIPKHIRQLREAINISIFAYNEQRYHSSLAQPLMITP